MPHWYGGSESSGCVERGSGIDSVRNICPGMEERAEKSGSMVRDQRSSGPLKERQGSPRSCKGITTPIEPQSLLIVLPQMSNGCTCVGISDMCRLY
jgi:hypothetical protein